VKEKGEMNKITILLVCCASLIFPQPAMACEPVPDYWFQETVEFAKVSLPDGFYLYEQGMPLPEPPPHGIWLSAADPAQTARTFISLVNQNEEPIFVLSLRYRDVLVMETPDPNWERRVDMAHEVASYLAVAGTRQILSLEMETLIDLDPALQDPNVLDISPPDPNLTIPSSQSSELLLVYQHQVIVVPFSITYRLNENFDNGRCEEWWASANATAAADSTTSQQVVQADQARQNNTLAFGLLALALIGLLFWLFTRLLLRGRD